MSLYTFKVDMQTDQLEHLREKVRTAQDETRSVQAKNELLERFVDQEPWFAMFVLTHRCKTPTSFFYFQEIVRFWSAEQGTYWCDQQERGVFISITGSINF